MSTLTAKERLEALKAQFNPEKKQNTNSYTKFYNFWKIAVGETAIVRFLPDLNKDNEREFVVENLTHTFNINDKKRVVACLEMHDGYGTCPVCALSRDYYNQARAAGETKEKPGALTALGKKFYRKQEFLGQVHVLQSPIEFEKNEGHENEMPVGLGPQIFKLIQAAFASGDLEEVPHAFKGGYDFRIIKSAQGDNANYTLSKFAPKQSDLSDDTIAGLNLYDLSTLRNRRIDKATLEAMIIADQTGQPLSVPGAVDEADDSASTTTSYTASPAVAEAVQTEAAPTVTAENGKVNDVLAQIRARAAAAKAA